MDSFGSKSDCALESSEMEFSQLPWKNKKTKDDAIKRWVISQEKYFPLRSNEMPSYETLDKSQSEDEAQESHSETLSFGDYINISSKNCVRKLSDLKFGDLKFGDLKFGDLNLGGDQPEETPNNQYKGNCNVQKIDGESPHIGKPVEYLSALAAPSPFDRPKETDTTCTSFWI
ncbi:uncharacterized protein LOC108151605 isoform X2 [Drosophila miranda]|uniref:uncharacterized protein LOC108151605 isoform X2 n=1 Tax=Drosophila miranda TaxID=7229 RepID=UPI00143F2A39|nr:uncharacterized protein LOC108151605 isoform X2 [Drosophila miranda]